MSTSLHSCKICQKTCSSRFNLNRHLKRTHRPLIDSNETLFKVQRPSGVRKKCILCSAVISSKDFNFHCQSVHDIMIRTSYPRFETMEEFNQWKHATEIETVSSYIKYKSELTLANGDKKIFFACHRSGYYKSRSNNVRHIKILGSNKIDGYCPAHINVLIKSDGVLVEFTETHMGHTMDLERLFLTSKEKKDIANKLAMKIPFQEILDNIRDSNSNQQLSRNSLLKKEDPCSIENSFNLNNSSLRQKCDSVSVDAWVNEMKKHGSLVRYYKSQGELCQTYTLLKQQDFFLVMFNNAQLQILQKFGNDCICIDRTHGLNAHDFELVTCLVVDDMRRGFPAAFLISNRTDSDAIEIFFKTIKDCIGGTIKPNVFMSDIAESFYNAWINVMDPPEKRLYCSWHVDHAWRINLNKISNIDIQIEVYKKIITLLEEPDEDAFELMMLRVCNDLITSEDTKSFGEYFKTYSNSSKAWAYCYRIHADINTNMHLERMHRTLKYLYLQGINAKRLDKMIHAIMRFIKDKLFDRLIILNKGKLSAKLQAIRKRHQAGITMSCVIERAQGSSWIITSSNETELCNIGIAMDCEFNCKLKCEECSSCIHKYVCSCPDSSIKWNMCKHIHFLLHHHLKKEAIPATRSTDYCEADKNLVIDLASIDRNVKEKNIMKDISSNNDNKNLSAYKKSLLKELSSLAELIKETNDEEALDVIENNIKHFKPAADSLDMKRDSENLSYNSSSNKKLKALPNVCLPPKAKKKRNPEKAITKPSQEEKDEIMASVLFN